MPLARLAAFIVFMAMLALIASPLRAEPMEKRVALVIGESSYQAGALPSAANDAGLVAQTLQAAGFDVIGARDLDATALRATLREFVDKARASGPDTVALVYFAGYGLQTDGENYVAPIDARIAGGADVSLEAIRLAELTKSLAATPLRARIVILDAARTNPFAKSGQPLSGGLALTQPDDGMLIAFNAAPGTVGPQEQGPFGAYAKALVEMIKAGGLPLDELFQRVRLRVSQATQGAEAPWHASRVAAPFLFFARSAEAPAEARDRFVDLSTKAISGFDARDAYLAALARDTLRGYQEFLAAYPHDPLAARVRAILAARREAMIWRETILAASPEAYWSYLRRYPRGPHAYEARRALNHSAADEEPPPSFSAFVYDVPPPPPEEIIYVERPYLYFADPVFAFAPPPTPPVIYLAPPPVYFVSLAPPPPPIEAFVLPFPIYHPVAPWVVPPPSVASPPLNVISANIHNTVIIDAAAHTAIVTNAVGQRLPPLPGGATSAQPSLSSAHPGAAAAIAAIAVALPTAAALHKAHTPASPTGIAPRQPLPAPPFSESAPAPLRSMSAPKAAPPVTAAPVVHQPAISSPGHAPAASAPLNRQPASPLANPAAPLSTRAHPAAAVLHPHLAPPTPPATQHQAAPPPAPHPLAPLSPQVHPAVAVPHPYFAPPRPVAPAPQAHIAPPPAPHIALPPAAARLPAPAPQAPRATPAAKPKPENHL